VFIHLANYVCGDMNFEILCVAQSCRFALDIDIMTIAEFGFMFADGKTYFGNLLQKVLK